MKRSAVVSRPRPTKAMRKLAVASRARRSMAGERPRPRPPRRRRPLVVLDAFCGAGGTITGARKALRRRQLAHRIIAINHWDVAIKTHEENHPDAVHVLANVYRQNPRDLVPDGKVDLFIASPTCSTFSRAKGGRPISWGQRYGRMTPTQVIRWCRELDVKCLLVENVPEFVEWSPCVPVWVKNKKTGELEKHWKPNPCKKGKLFRAWIRRLEALGFKVEWRVLNAADFGDATTRKRFFLIARRDGKPLRWPRPTHARAGEAPDLFSGLVKPWRAARDIIDWDLLGKSIFDRKKPLAPATLVRMWVGAVREGWPAEFVHLLRLYAWALDIELPAVDREPGRTKGEPFVVQLNQSRERARGIRGVDEPLGTVTASGTDLGLVVPFRRNANGQSPDKPLPTITAGGGRGGGHMGLAEGAFLFGNRANNVPRGVSEPAPGATTATGGGIGLVSPFVLAQGEGGAARPAGEPVPTIPTRGALSLIAAYYSNGAPTSVREPLPTATTKDRFALVTPVTHEGGPGRAKSDEEPLPTVTAAARGELGLIVAAFGEREGQAPRWHSLSKPLPTLCAKGRIQLVQAVRTDLGIDILFRMLTPRELARAMGFPDSYKWPAKKTDATTLIGNAVPVHMARALADALVGAGT